ENPLVPEEDYRTPYDPTKPEDTPKVTDNDKLGGKPVVPDENVVIEDKTPENHPESPVTINPDGTITVEEGTPSGEYPFSYEICEIDADGNKVGECKVVEGSVVVENPLVPEEDYQTPYDPTQPEETPKVTDNDKLGGKPVVPGENVVIEDKTPDNHPESPITINPNGTINVPEGTPSGEYPFSYEICEIDGSGNKVGECKVVEGSVVVENPLIPENDLGLPYDPMAPEETPKVTDNDKLSGKPVIPGEHVTITNIPVGDSPVTVNPDGTITVAEGTPRGEYPFSYEICEIGANPANCKVVTGTVEVLIGLIEPEDDRFTSSWSRETGITPSVLDNDRFNRNPINLDEVTLTPGTPSDPGLRMNPDGTITIAPSTRPGTYEYPYTICEVLNPTNCSSAVAIIVVEAD